MESAPDPFVRVTFPDGSSLAIRLEYSGVVYDQAQQVADPELAMQLLLIKAQKFARKASLGAC